jgi:hypothetical protein
MKTFNNCCAQGDVCFIRVKRLPNGLTETKPEDGALIITHSETGHHHIMMLDRVEDRANVRLYSGDNPLIAWLEVNRPTALEHKRNFDTHEPILFPPGIYQIRRQREYVPEGFRQVQD